MELIAHRGACFDAPENSMAAFEAAVVQGAARLELDVQVTSDGVPVVCHDPTTGRVADVDLEIEFSTLAEVRQARLANGEAIPTLEEVCRLSAGRVTLDVEMKATSSEVMRSVLELLRETKTLEDALITSFDPEVLRHCRVLGFDGRTGLLVGSRSLHVRQRAYEAWPLRTLRECEATDLVIHHLLLHRVLRRALRRAGTGCVLWTAVEDEAKEPARRAAMYRRAALLEPDGLIVGRIAEVREVLGLRAEPDAAD